MLGVLYYENKQSKNAQAVAHAKQKRSEDVAYRTECNLRRRFHKALKAQGARKCVRSLAFVGCSPVELREHLASQFTDGMSWDNYGAWHIDHIRPCASFDLTDLEQQKACFHYTNLQPMWAAENLAKSDRWESAAV